MENEDRCVDACFQKCSMACFGASILGKARIKESFRLNAVNFRDYSNNKHNTVMIILMAAAAAWC